MAGKLLLSRISLCELQDCPLLAALQISSLIKTQDIQFVKTRNSGWQLMFLITLELRNKNKHKEHESAAHRVSRLTTNSLIYTYIYIIEPFLPLV